MPELAVRILASGKSRTKSAQGDFFTYTAIPNYVLVCFVNHLMVCLFCQAVRKRESSKPFVECAILAVELLCIAGNLVCND